MVTTPYWSVTLRDWAQPYGEASQYFAQAAGSGSQERVRGDVVNVKTPFKYTDYWVSTRRDMRGSSLVKGVPSRGAYARGGLAVWGQIDPENCSTGKRGFLVGSGCGKDPRFKVFRVYKPAHADLLLYINQHVKWTPIGD